MTKTEKKRKEKKRVFSTSAEQPILSFLLKIWKKFQRPTFAGRVNWRTLLLDVAFDP
jgi:hypothetical protein